MLSPTRLLTLMLPLLALLTLLTPSTLASWFNDCDNSRGGHCIHGPSEVYMRDPHLYFQLESGTIMRQGPGPINNTVVLLSENASGGFTFNCKFGAPSKWKFETTPTYSYVEVEGPFHRARATFVGSNVFVSYLRGDKLADVSHRPGIDLLLYCPFDP